MFLSQHFQALSGLRAQSQFDTTSSQVRRDHSEQLCRTLGACFSALVPIAENVRGELTTILTQLASNVLFFCEWRICRLAGAFNLEDKKTIENALSIWPSWLLSSRYIPR